MGEFLGALAGSGMLLLVAALFCVFLRECGALSKERLGRMVRAALTVGGVAAAYLMAGALLYGVFYEPASNPFEIDRIFRFSALEKMCAALHNPSFYAPVSGLFAYMGHGVGELLFGQYLLGGQVLALSMAWLSSWLILERMEAIVGRKAAEEGLFLLLSLPGMLFVFLPGWPPVAFLAIATTFFLLGKRLSARAFSYPASGYACVLAISALLSALLLYAMVMGQV